MANAAPKLSPALDAFVEEQIASGAYDDREAVIVDALELMREQVAADAVDDETKLARLNLKLQKAIDGLDRGEGIEITDLDAYFDGVMKRARGETARGLDRGRSRRRGCLSLE